MSLFIQEATEELLQLLCSQKRVSEETERFCQGVRCPRCTHLPTQKIHQAIREQ